MHIFFSIPLSLSLILLASTILTSCTSLDVTYSDDRMFATQGNDVPSAPMIILPPPVLSIHSQEVMDVVQEVSVEFHHKRELTLKSSKTYYNEEGIHTIQIQYDSQTLIDPSEARELIVDVVDLLIAKLNANKLLVPEFQNYTISPENFEIYISFNSYFARYVDPFYIRLICMENGMIKYYAADIYDNDKKKWHFKIESFVTSKNITVSQRAAEDDYKQRHNRDIEAIFGKDRYIPKED